jgi:hypothetical protein
MMMMMMKKVMAGRIEKDLILANSLASFLFPSLLGEEEG